jgi:hypothetical protein
MKGNEKRSASALEGSVYTQSARSNDQEIKDSARARPLKSSLAHEAGQVVPDIGKCGSSRRDRRRD